MTDLENVRSIFQNKILLDTHIKMMANIQKEYRTHANSKMRPK